MKASEFKKILLEEVKKEREKELKELEKSLKTLMNKELEKLTTQMVVANAQFTVQLITTLIDSVAKAIGEAIEKRATSVGG